MAKNKPTKPTNLMPRSFGGEKNGFSDDLIASGFEINVPQTYNGDNLNYQLNATGKEFEYVESVVDYIVAMPSNNILTVNSNNQLDYLNANTLAVDNNVVHKTGDEAVAGTKTFNNTIVGSVNGNANTATNDIDGNPIKTTYQKVSNLSQVINESTTKYPSCNAVKTTIDANWSACATSLNGKLNTDVSTNISATGKSFVAGLSMPSAKFETQTVGASGAIYNAPANGWYCGSCVEGGVRLENTSANNFGVHSPMTVWSGGKAYIPCQKGDKIAFEYSGTTKILTFYYAEGDTPSESEV